MNDQISDQFSADKVRKIVNNHIMEADQKVAEIKAMLSPPKRPTLAHMDEGERAASQWMQADVPDLGERHVIAVPCDDNDDMVGLISADELASVNGGIRWMHPENVTPRPDLPRLDWPGDTKVEDVPALPGDWQPAHHHRIGRVIVTNPIPNPGGHIYFVTSDDEDPRGYQWGLCTPDELTYIDIGQGTSTSDAVPPDTLDLGSMWIDSGALAQACKESERDQIVALDNTGEAYVWSWDADWWEGSVPPQFAPFTIINDGKKAHQ